METLPQLPEPHLFHCERCGEPMDLWDWGSYSVTTADLPPARCSWCLIEVPEEPERDVAPFLRRAEVDQAQQLHHRMRRSIGPPPGTVIAWQLDLRDKNDWSQGHPAYLYAVHVDRWYQDWPQLVLPWRLSWDSLTVVFGAHVLAGRGIPASWRFLWQWHDPLHKETLVLDPPDASLSKDQILRLNKARGAFYEFHETRGRTPRFANLFEFYLAAHAAVVALRKGRRPITPATIGRYLIERGPLTNRPDRIGERPADPGRQFRKWCDSFGYDAEVLLEELQHGL
jgi:hypothetical protein